MQFAADYPLCNLFFVASDSHFELFQKFSFAIFFLNLYTKFPIDLLAEVFSNQNHTLIQKDGNKM